MHAITPNLLASRPLCRLVVFCIALASGGSVSAADPAPTSTPTPTSVPTPRAPPPTPVQVPYAAVPELQNEVAAASCIEITRQPASGIAHVAPRDATSEFLLYRPAEKQTAQVTILANVGTATRADNKCPGTLTLTAYNVSIGGEPTIPPDALDKAFRVLVAAFVVALLLESAFELLFNWRLFQAFFVGRAWRTPIMFAISLLVVRQFDLDLMASLFNAYHGGPGPVAKGSWTTSCLTAMILGGGSVGVNRILVGLGFRSRLPKAEQEVAQLDTGEAWVSIEIRSSKPTSYRIDMNDVACNGTPATLAVLQASGPGRLRQLLFPSSFRTPPSGGRRVDINKCYEITIVHLPSGDVYDVGGRKIVAPQKAAPLRFASRAIVDFVVPL